MGEDKGGGREEIIKILEDNGREEAWMKRLQDRRKLKEIERREEEEERGTDRDGQTIDRSIIE